MAIDLNESGTNNCRKVVKSSVKKKMLKRRSWFQPYSAYIGLVWVSFIVIFYGYSSFRPWSVSNFFTYYTMVILAPILFFGRKLIKRTHWRGPQEFDLSWEAPAVAAYGPCSGFVGGGYGDILI
ncbi:MAG: hypothetical protein STHCBS139747_005421 [Sporothrix thermara]